ncbi:MAG: hypothetical protein ACP5FK_11390 [bacterium]
MIFISGCTDYDYDTPDTPANLDGFTRHLKMEVTSDVDSVYYYADEMGSDVTYMLNFKCREQTVQNIIDQLNLNSFTQTYCGITPRGDLSWWDNHNVLNLPGWSRRTDDYYRYLWYDQTTGHVYYLEFSM